MYVRTSAYRLQGAFVLGRKDAPISLQLLIAATTCFTICRAALFGVPKITHTSSSEPPPRIRRATARRISRGTGGPLSDGVPVSRLSANDNGTQALQLQLQQCLRDSTRPFYYYTVQNHTITSKFQVTHTSDSISTPTSWSRHFMAYISR